MQGIYCPRSDLQLSNLFWNCHVLRQLKKRLQCGNLKRLSFSCLCRFCQRTFFFVKGQLSLSWKYCIFVYVITIILSRIKQRTGCTTYLFLTRYGLMVGWNRKTFFWLRVFVWDFLFRCVFSYAAYFQLLLCYGFFSVAFLVMGLPFSCLLCYGTSILLSSLL